MDENVSSSPDVTLPPPLLGCLICHAENTLTLSEGRQFFGKVTVGTRYPILTCANCGAVAQFIWDEEQPDRWRIRYRKVSADFPYTYASVRFKKTGWLNSDEALDISTDVYVQRQRLQQVNKGDLSWLKPGKLTPPPPLMSPDEVVYLALKPASYCETSFNRLVLPIFKKADVILDTGTLYVTDAKVHLLGQRRDRSHRLSEIRDLHYQQDVWRIHVSVGDKPHHYQGFSLSNVLDAELIVAVVESLCHAEKE